MATLTVMGTRDAQVEDVLRASDRITAVTWTTEIGGLVDAKAPQPDVLLIDVRRARDLPHDLAALKRQHPATNVILLTSSLDPGLMLQAMRAGVNECLPEPLNKADFEAAITRIIGQQRGTHAGAIFAFVGAKGGVGTTTAAVNVATALAALPGSSALFMDLHLAYGDAAVFLGADARFSVLDALENLHRLDQEFFRSLVTHTSCGLDLLASADRPTTRLLDVRRLGSILQLAASLYTYTVLDLPRSDLAVLDSLEHLSNLVVVANQELATVRNAGRMAATLRARYPSTKVTTVINRTDGRAEIGQRDVEKVVGGAITHQIPSDYRRALLAMHKGRPLALDNHNELSASFTALARELAGVGSDRPKSPRNAGPSGGLIGFLSGRR